MKTLLLILCLVACNASAQFRYARYQLPSSSTNTTITSNTVATYNSSADVAPTTRADIRLAFKLMSVDTNAMHAACTNWVTAVFDKSVDGTYFTNRFILAVRGNSNSTVWTQTNVGVTDAAFLRLVCVTNDNTARITNFSIFVGCKQGL